MEIVQVKEEYKGKEIVFRYTSEYYYEVYREDFSVRFVRTPFGQEVHKEFKSTLLEDWLENPELYVIKEKDEMIGFIEISLESWNRRLRISNIWVDDSRRHQGLGSRLMNKAMERAKVLGARALVLETQSCNDKAISFYKKHGFTMIGFDLISYSNEDINKKEVRIEMGKCL